MASPARSRARRFGFDNVLIVLGETGVLNNALRFDDEVRAYKILDVIGDLALVGHPVVGHLVAHRGGHALHTAFAAKILEERDAWKLVEAQADGDGHSVGKPVTVAARLANQFQTTDL